MSDALVIWTIYDHPRDFPDHYVARKWEVLRGGYRATLEVLVWDNLTHLREEMALRGLTCLPRSPDDDKAIIESWI